MWFNYHTLFFSCLLYTKFTFSFLQGGFVTVESILWTNRKVLFLILFDSYTFLLLESTTNMKTQLYIWHWCDLQKELCSVKGISEAKAEKIVEAAKRVYVSYSQSIIFDRMDKYLKITEQQLHNRTGYLSKAQGYSISSSSSFLFCKCIAIFAYIYTFTYFQ